MKTQIPTRNYCFVISENCGIGVPDLGVINLHKGAIWAADDPVVRARPEFFGVDPAPDSIIRSTGVSLQESQRATLETWPGVAS